MARQNTTAFKIGVFSRAIPMLFFAFLALVKSLYGQGQTSSFDSVDYIVHNNQISDSSKIDKLSRIGMMAILHSYDSGMLIAEKMSAVVQSAGDDRLSAHVYQIYGILHAQYGDYENGVNYFMKAYSIFKAHGDKFNLAKTVNNLAGMYSFQHEYADAISMIDEALHYKRK